MTEFREVEGGPNGLPVFVTRDEARRRRMAPKLIGDGEDQFTPKYLFEASAPPGPDGKLALTVLSQAAALEESFEEVEKRRQRVLRDRGLNDQGRRERLQQLAKAHAGRIREIAKGSSIEDLEERLLGLEDSVIHGSVRLRPEDGDEALQERQAAEVRAEIRSMDENQRLELLMEAAEQDDRAVLRAFAEVPPTMSLVPEGEMALARETHARTRWPERMDQIEQLRSTVSRLKRNVNSAFVRLAEQTGDDQFRVLPFGSSGSARSAKEAEAALAEA